MHTFAISQYGERLMPRKAEYKYANCLSYLVKEDKDGDGNTLKKCTLVDTNISRQDRDTYIEVENLEEGAYWLYVDMDWQTKSFEHLKGKLNFSINCYGEGDAIISDNKSKDYDQIDCLNDIFIAYSNYHIENETGVVTCNKDKLEGIEIFEEDNYWKTGY